MVWEQALDKNLDCCFLLYSYKLHALLFPFRFSVSNDLKYDAERDLRDIGAKNILVHSLNKVWILFTMYSSGKTLGMLV